MVITQSPRFFPTRAARQENPPCEQEPNPTPPTDAFNGGRLAAGIAGGALAGAGLGYLGANAGGMLGFIIGMETTVPAEGLSGLFFNSMQGAAWGTVVGAALYGAIGVGVGAIGATWLYDKATAQ